MCSDHQDYAYHHLARSAVIARMRGSAYYPEVSLTQGDAQSDALSPSTTFCTATRA